MEQMEEIRLQRATEVDPSQLSPKSSPRKDNYKDLKLQQNEFKEEPSLQSYRVSGFLDVRRLAKARCETVSPGGLGALQDPKMGIQTGRIGGEGKKHIFPKQNMVHNGVSTSEGMRNTEGRRYIPTIDSLMEQKKENEAHERVLMERGCDGPAPVNRPSNHVSEDHMAYFGCRKPM
eukprot:g9031.t1